ncbi:hypothetical protein GE21DRAFT_7172 [Neurospora crassa]|uniref:Integral membrane protein n=2 Tax=Neurospora crassa TaxID=5141 RepID=F5H8T9_NEUCR|nr:integral membrane protein [Neurospora crassa OR74A]EAA32092.2 integral membrane protein [Neurospora crassa OR74A]KAK3501734.1 SUR7/PalI family-domain-containing protein [Neurospora crassa]KHE88810.1 hypothetical protein GE21DRAFT_7172 [Neurospora crassa]CAD21277.1 conserved hypothetical protein [Neurospora crassa]|eukprot:XP_961328.2 integral membrane protein [Neurospora crassa OR74A]
MGLKSLLNLRKRNSLDDQPKERYSPQPQTRDASYERTLQGEEGVPSDEQIKRATRLRRYFAWSASFGYLVSWVFLILILIGNTSDKPVLRNVYFYKLNLADIIPESVPNAQLINSIAQSIGLHDFYQVGLWNFCEGYQSEGITYCSEPETLYWFNPVKVIMSELLSGATVAIPTAIITILSVLRITSQIMFGFFLTACVLNFVLIFVSPILPVKSRWWSLPLSLFSFASMILTLAASIIGTVISYAFKYAAEAQSDLNIHADVGTYMFVFMWIATGFTMWSFAVHSGMGCCCASKRDLKSGRRLIKPDGRIIHAG